MARKLLPFLALALAGCQVPAQLHAAPGFVLAPERGGAAPIAAAVVPAAIPIALGEQVRGDAALTVDVRSALPPAVRRLMATLADVAKVSVRIQGTGVDQTLELTKAQLDGGTTSVTFANLPAGPYQVTVRALNAASAVIGSDIRQATVTAGQTTTVQASVKLDPTIATPRTLPSPTAGGSGGSGGGASTGSLTAAVTLQDGVPVHYPAIVGVYAPAQGGAYYPGGAEVEIDADGHAWVAWTGSADFARISPTGQIEPRLDLPAGTVDLLMAPDRQKLYTPGAANRWITRTGVLGPAIASPGGTLYNWGERSGLAPDGAVYFDSYRAGRIWRVAPDGTQSTFFPRQAQRFAVAPDGDVWVAEWVWPAGAAYPDFTAGMTPSTVDPIAVMLSKHAPDGTARLSRRIDLPDAWPQPAAHAFLGSDLEVDASGQPWFTFPGHQRMVRLTPAGEILDWRPYAGGQLYADADRGMWLASSETVGRFGADGTISDWYHLGQGVGGPNVRMAVADDQLWVSVWGFGVIHADLTP